MVQLAKSTAFAVLIFFFTALNQIAYADVAVTCSVPSAVYPTIQTAVNDAACSTIDVAAGTFSENVTVARSLIIRGAVDGDNAPQTTVSGQSVGSVFTVNGFNTVVLRNLIIRDGQAVQGGGVRVADNGSVTIDNALLIDNRATTGAGVYAQSGFLNVANSTLRNNDATGDGGGIMGALGSVDVRGTNFYDNSAENGGAIAVASAFLVVMTADFSGNTASSDGGGVFLSVPNGSSVFTSVNLNNNSAEGNGGAMYARRAVELKNSLLHRNQASDGGALYIERNNLNLMQTTVTWNSAAGNGGAIFQTKTAAGFVADAKLTVTKSTLSDNRASGSGGAIYAAGDIDTTLNAMGIYRNQADGSGGALAIVGAEAVLKVNDSVVQFNAAPAGVGGAIFTEDGVQFILSRSYMTSNSAGLGGAVASAGENDVRLYTSAIVQNSAESGGGVHVAGGDLIVDQMLLAQNAAHSGAGGGLYMLGDISIRNTTVYSNSAATGGGLAHAGGGVDVAAVAFDGNLASSSGGGIAIIGATTGQLRNSSVTNNSAENGGGIHISNSFRMSRVLVGFNSATQNGGGIHITGADVSEVVIDQTSVYQNAAITGGGIDHAGKLLNITNSTISENSATALGSALHGPGPVIAAYSTIASNVGVSAIHKLPATTPFIFQFSIIDNTTVDNCSGDIGTIQLATTIDSDGTCALTRTTLSGIDPLLAPLANNGNDQMSHALLAGSPAIGLGTDCPLFDQHDTTRPARGCDLGAYQSLLLPTAVSVTSQGAQAASALPATPFLLLALVGATILAFIRQKGTLTKQVRSARRR